MLSSLQPKYGESIGLYRDDGVGDPHNNAKENGESKRRYLQNLPRKRLENHYRSKQESGEFPRCNTGLNSGQYMRYMQPNNKLQYVNTKSNHPPTVLKNIPLGINKRLSGISSNEKIFKRAAPVYQKALDKVAMNFNYITNSPGRKWIKDLVKGT